MNISAWGNLDGILIPKIMTIVYRIYLVLWTIISCWAVHKVISLGLEFMIAIRIIAPQAIIWITVALFIRLVAETIIVVLNIHDNLKTIAAAVTQNKAKDICKSIDNNTNKVILIANEMLSEVITARKTEPQAIAPISRAIKAEPKPIEPTPAPIKEVKSPPKKALQPLPPKPAPTIMPELGGLILKVY